MILYILKQQYEQIKSSSLSQESFLETKKISFLFLYILLRNDPI